MKAVEFPALEVDERSTDDSVGTVIPRGWIRRGASENSGSCAAAKLLPEVSAVDRVEAWSPWQVKSPETRDQRGVRVVIGHVEVVSAIDEALQRLLACGRGFGQLSPPVAAQIPVGTADASDVSTENHSDVRTVDVARTVAERLDIVETDAPTSTVH